MSTTAFLTVTDLAGRLHMAVEGLKKKPGLMNSGVGYLKLVEDNVQAVADAKKNGRLVGQAGRHDQQHCPQVRRIQTTCRRPTRRFPPIPCPSGR